LLKKYRPRAPINGIIVTVSIGELMGNSPSFAINLAKSLRQRVQELTEKLEVFAPVYVLFTKVDLIPGFHEFFLDLDWNERDRVWGATIPYEQAGGNELIALFDRHFDELYEGLRAMSVAQMSRQQGEATPPGVLTFPAEFASIKPALRAFVATLFEDNPFQFKPIFRGFYITSAIQGNDIKPVINDRILRKFSLQGGGNGQGQCGDLEENIGHAGQQDQDHAGEQELAQPGEVPLADCSDGGQGEEDGTRAAGSQRNHRAAVGEAEGYLQDARQHQAHEEGEAKQQRDAEPAVLVLLDTPHETPGNTEEEHEGNHRAAGEEAETHLDTGQCTEDGRDHRQAEQHVGVAQDAVLFQREAGSVLAGDIDVGVHVRHSLRLFR
jgi:hypothetical protein